MSRSTLGISLSAAFFGFITAAAFAQNYGAGTPWMPVYNLDGPLLDPSGLLTPGSQGGTAPETAMFSLMLLRQGSTNNNGVTTTVRTPVQSRFTNASLLRQLVIDAHAGGKYSSTNLPGGAKLAYHSGFVVEDKTGNQLFDASGILRLEFGTNCVASAIMRNDGSLPFASTTHGVVTVIYDAAAFGGKFGFRASGLGTLVYKATKTNSRGNHREASDLIVSFAGDGTDALGNSLVLTGTVAIAGSIISETQTLTGSASGPTLLSVAQGVDLMGAAQGGTSVAGHQGNTNGPPSPPPLPPPSH